MWDLGGELMIRERRDEARAWRGISRFCPNPVAGTLFFELVL
jgi:hypothetical protein